MAGDEGNKYDDIIRSQVDPARDALTLSRRASYGMDPAKAREILSLNAKTDLPPLHLEQSLDPAYRDRLNDRLQESKYDAILKNAPSTARWAADPFRLKAGQEDLERLARIEGMLREQAKPKPASDKDLEAQARALVKGQVDKDWAALQAEQQAQAANPFIPFSNSPYMEANPHLFGLLAATSRQDVEDYHVRREAAKLKNEDAFRTGDEDKLSFWARTGTAIQMGLRHGARTNEYGRLGHRMSTGDKGADVWAAVEQVDRDLAAAPHGGSFAARWLYTPAKLLGQMLDTASAATTRAYQGAAAGATAATIVGQAGPQVALPEEVVTVPATALAGGIAGLTAGMAEQSYIIEAGAAYLDLEKLRGKNGEQVDEGTKQAVAAGVGLINASLEMIGLKFITAPAKAVAKKFISEAAEEAVVKPTMRAALATFAKEYGKAIAGETSTEVIQEVTNVLGEEIAKMATKGDFETFANSPEIKAQVLERLLTVASETLRGTIVLGGIGGGVRLAGDIHTARQQQAHEKAVEFVKMLESVGKDAGESELAKENLNEIEAIAKATVKDTDAADHWLPAEAAEKYFSQKGLDPAAEVAKIIGDSKAYEEALPRKGDIQIPAEKWISISQGEHKAFFQENLRRAPDEMNMAETKAAIAEQKAEEKRRETAPALPQSLSETGEGVTGDAFASLRERQATDAKKYVDALPDGRYVLTYSDGTQRAVEVQSDKAGAMLITGEAGPVDLAKELIPQREQDGSFTPPPSIAAEKQHKKAVKDMSKAAESVKQIGDQIVQALEAGGFKAEAKRLGAVAKHLFKRLGERTGKDPLEIFNRYNLQIQRQETEAPAEGRSMNQPEAQEGRLPEWASKRASQIREKYIGTPVGKYVDALLSRGTSPSSVSDAGMKFSLEQIGMIDPDMNDEIRSKYFREASPDYKDAPLFRQMRDEVLSLAEEVYRDDRSRGISRMSHRLAYEHKEEAGAKPGAKDIAGTRGRLVIGKSSISLDLFAKADRSTFLHEMGHFYLEVIQDLVSQPNADKSLLADMAAIREWMGLKDGEAITEEHHEKFARAFEVYLQKGEAPTKALRKAFWFFKRWLNDIYREVKGYFEGVELTPKLKDVMDRMLASEDEIFEARMERGGYLFEGKAAELLTPEQQARLSAAQDEATQEAEERLMASLMHEIDREDAAEWKAEKAKLKEEAIAELGKQPVYRALYALTTKDAGGYKLLRSEVEGVFTALPKGITAEDGVHPDAFADWFGFKDGTALLYALSSAEDINVAADRMAEERMLAMNPRMTPSEVKEKAVEALHGPKREALHRLEMKLLAESAAGRKMVRDLAFYRPRLDVLDEDARRDMESVGVGKLRPSSYLSAEVRSAKETLAAAQKGDIQGAIDAKLRELMNHARYVAAIEFRDGVKEFIVETRKMAKSDEKIAKTRDVDLVNAARAILAKWGVGRFKGEPSDFLGQLKDNSPQEYEAVMAEVTEAIRDARPYKEATFAEFHKMRDAVRALWSIAKSTRELVVQGKRESFEEGKEALSADLDALPADYANYGRRGKPKLWDRIKVAFLSAKALARRVEPWAQAMGKNFTKYIWDPVNDAVIGYRSKRVEVLRKYFEIVRARPEIFQKGVIKAAELDGYEFENKAHLLGALLHAGNESNLMKLIVGHGWGEWDADTETFDRTKWDAFIKRMVKKEILTKADYDFAQGVWDLNESIKPIAQKAHKEMFGRYFKEVTANEVVTPWGTYRGGYVPATIDTSIVEDIAIKKALEENGGFNAEYALPTTTKGFTMARSKGYAQPLVMDLRLIPKHVDEVLRFSYIQPRVNEVKRLLTDKDVARAIQAHDPSVLRGMLIPWLDRAVKQRSETAGWNKHLDSFFRGIRKNAGMQLMAGNITNAMQNVTGLSVALTKVDARHLRNALVDYMKHPKDFAASILERSEFMKQTIDNDASDLIRDIDDLITNPNAFQKAQAFGQKHAQILQRLIQNPVNLITWQGAFEQAMEGMDGNSESDVDAAIREADAAVRLTQGSQGPESIARFEAGTPFLKLFTQFTGYFNNKANLLGTEFYRTVQELGMKRGAGRLFATFFFGHAVPAIIGYAILKTMAGTWSDEDDDGYLDEVLALFFGSQFREATGYFPVVGNFVNVGIEAFGGTSVNDRVMNGPAIDAIDKAAKYPAAVYDSIQGDLKKRAVQDTLSLIGLMSGLPSGALGRPLGYLMDVDAGKAEPSGPLDFARGLLTGKRGE